MQYPTRYSPALRSSLVIRWGENDSRGGWGIGVIDLAVTDVLCNCYSKGIHTTLY